MCGKEELFFLILMLSLNLSCINDTSTDKGLSKPESVNSSMVDTLKFTSGVRAIFQDSKSNYWFGSHKEGVCLFDGNKFQYFTTDDGLQGHQIRSIQEDDNGVIWIATAKGVNSYQGGEFTSYSIKFNASILDWNATTGSLWFYAGEEDGINRFDGKNMNYLVFPKPESIDPYNSFGVTGISKDSRERVWIGTYSALFCYDGKEVDVFSHENLNLKEDEKIHIRSVLADSKGRIWIGNNGIGVILLIGDSTVHFSKEHEKLIPFKEHDSNFQNDQASKNVGLQSVFAIEEDSEGHIWFADRDSGLWRYDGSTLTNYIVDEKLKSQMIWDICLDKDNNLLFGMAEGGVYQFDGKSFDRKF